MISQEQYVTLLEEMIATPGWDILQKEAETQIYHLQSNALEAKDWDEVQRTRGKAEQLAELVALPHIVRAQREELEIEAVVEDDFASL